VVKLHQKSGINGFAGLILEHFKFSLASVFRYCADRQPNADNRWLTCTKNWQVVGLIHCTEP